MSTYSKPDDPYLLYTGEPFALREVIYVNFNYREGARAMLVDPNLFFFDQNLAIRWVHNNIDDFCGDHEHITLFGSSYGANAIQYHLISKQSNGMIKNAIIQSSTFYFNVICHVICLTLFPQTWKLKQPTLSSGSHSVHLGRYED